MEDTISVFIQNKLDPLWVFYLANYKLSVVAKSSYDIII